MRVSLLVIAALVVFDLGVAVLASLGLITPQATVALLLTNPLALILNHQLRGRRMAAAARRRG